MNHEGSQDYPCRFIDPLLSGRGTSPYGGNYLDDEIV